jgi:hypothetical protein
MVVDDIHISQYIPPCAGTPVPGATTGPATVCPDATFNLGLETTHWDAGITFQWFRSIEGPGGPWTPFGSNAPSQTTSILVPTWFYCAVSCDASGTANSGVLSVGLNIAMHLSEDFSTLGFPPCWSNSGYVGWSPYSAYGSGYGSMLFDFKGAWRFSMLTSPRFAPVPAGTTLRFDVAGASNPDAMGPDIIAVAESMDGGATWQSVAILDNTYPGGILNTAGPHYFFTPTPAYWTTLSFPLSPGVDRIRFVGNGSQYGSDIYIDNVVCELSSCGIAPGTPIVVCESATAGTTDTYRVIIPYTGVHAGVTVVNNSGSGIVEGNDPAVVENGTIQINNISEMDDYSVTFSSPCASYTISGNAPVCDGPLPLTVVINEVDYDNPGLDNDEWIELYNYGPDPVNAGNLRIELVNGINGGGTVYQTINIDSPLAIPPGGYFVVGNNASNPAVDYVPLGAASSNFIQNGAPDAIALIDRLTGALIDVISYEGNTAAPYIEGTGVTGGDDETPGKVIARVPNGVDTNDNNADWQEWCATPGTSNDSAPDDDGDGIPNCMDPCPLALNGIANFDMVTCSCEPGYDVTITSMGGNDVITACTSNFDCPLLGADIGDPCDDGNAGTDNDIITGDCVCSGTAPVVTIAARVVLEGCYDAGSGLMRDDLRALGLVPTLEPYTGLGHGYVNGGGETTSPTVLATTGDDAIVDWVIVELRDKTDPTIIHHSRAALLQRDGDVVAVDGISAVTCPLPADDYFVAVLHRNHLAVMTASPGSLTSNATTVDLTLPGAAYGTNARKSVLGNYPTLVLWAGDVNFDGMLRYTGQDNDRDPILAIIGGSVPTNTAVGYHGQDVNMDGLVRYTGEGNDRDPILQNIGGAVPTNVRLQQMP